MFVTRRSFVGGSSAAMLTLLSACASNENQTDTPSNSAANAVTSLTFDSSAWRYNADDDVYYQLGISYCETPADESYEKLAILVPAAYMNASDNGDGSFTCELNAKGKVGAYTAESAPVVMPVNTPGYSAQKALSEYASKSEYTSQGLVYLHAGCRGREHGAPTGVTDLKAAVRFLRAFSDKIPGDAERIFTFGHSGGGAQSALMGATGDAPEYDAYLEAIGAVQGVSDAIYGSMDWCPITNLDSADAAYEWMMGCTRSGLSDEEQAISNGLAEAFADYINAAQIPGNNGSALTLEKSEEGIWQAGSYYEKLKATIEESLNNFLSDTSFPYDGSSSSGMGSAPSGAAPGGEPPAGEVPGGEPPSGEAPSGAPSGEPPSGSAPSGAPSTAQSGTSASSTSSSNASEDSASTSSEDGISRTSSAGGVSTSGSYETAEEYIAALNANGEWVSYNEKTNTATITSVEAFCAALKQASKSLGAFDQLDRGQGENTLFGENGEPRHFDATLACVLDELNSSYATDYAEDLALTDVLGTDAATRLNMYTPLYYLLASQNGYGQATPARHWRIRSGITQGDTALSCELNLALAAQAHPKVDSVDFATVWAQGHTEAERSGSASENFITWIGECTV